MTITASVIPFQCEHWLTRYFSVITIDLTETAIHNCGCSLAVEVLNMSQFEEYSFVLWKNIITNAVPIVRGSRISSRISAIDELYANREEVRG